MSRRYVLTTLLVLVFSGAMIAATLVVDQQAPPAVSPADFTFAVGGPHEQVLSQTVTAGVAGRLWQVNVPIGCENGTVILEIRDVDSSGQPGPTLLYTRGYPASHFPGIVTDAFQPLRLIGHPVRFAAGDTFTISLSNPTGSCGLWPGPVGDPYPGGTGWADADDGPIVPVSLGYGTDDLPFQTIVRPH